MAWANAPLTLLLGGGVAQGWRRLGRVEEKVGDLTKWQTDFAKDCAARHLREEESRREIHARINETHSMQAETRAAVARIEGLLAGKFGGSHG